jgi:hypothetical protein
VKRADENLTAIANFRTRLEAETASGLLAAEGIPYLIQSREGAGLGPGPAGASILVREKHAAQAREILEDAGAIGGGPA